MAGWIHSRQLEVIDFLREENRVFQGQLGRRRLRFTDAGLVAPDTILRRYRELIARKYDGSARRRTGCPTVAIDVEQLVVRMATENPTWGYTRLVGALDNLGHQVARNTVKRVIRRHRLEAAPVRGKRLPWKTFLRTHLGAIAGRTSSRSRCSRSGGWTTGDGCTRRWCAGRVAARIGARLLR